MTSEPRVWSERFDVLAHRYRECVAAWYTLDVGMLTIPNDHSDSSYDVAVLERLTGVVRQAADLLDRLVTEAPELAPHRDRLRRLAADGVGTSEVAALQDSWAVLESDALGALGTPDRRA